MTIVACPSPPPVVTPGIVVFDFTEFTGIYPEFATAAQAACQNNFNLATLLLSNSCGVTQASGCCKSASGSPVFNPAVRQSLLYMLTAHITFLNTPCGANNNQPPGIVGRINTATEGSVSVGAEMPGATINAAYFLQTKYGAQFWAMTASVRSMRYIPPARGCGDGRGEGYGAFFGPSGTGNCGYNGGSA